MDSFKALSINQNKFNTDDIDNDIPKEEYRKDMNLTDDKISYLRFTN